MAGIVEPQEHHSFVGSSIQRWESATLLASVLQFPPKEIGRAIVNQLGNCQRVGDILKGTCERSEISSQSTSSAFGSQGNLVQSFQLTFLSLEMFSFNRKDLIQWIVFISVTLEHPKEWKRTTNHCRDLWELKTTWLLK